MTILTLLGILFFTFENVSCGCVVKPPINQDSPQVAQIGIINSLINTLIILMMSIQV